MDILSLFDRYTANVKSGQKIIGEIMDASKVKTAADASKVRDKYRDHLAATVKDKAEAASILRVFNVRMSRWLAKNGIKAAPRRGGRKAKAKAAPAAKAASVTAKGSPAATVAKAAASGTLQGVTLASLESQVFALIAGLKRADIQSVKARFIGQFDTLLKAAKA